MNGKIYNSLAELELARKIEKVTTFTTSDGKIFNYESQALEHERMLNPQRVEARDLLNKLVLLANKNLTDDYLQNIKAYAERVLESESNASYNEEQYYNSNCY